MTSLMLHRCRTGAINLQSIDSSSSFVPYFRCNVTSLMPPDRYSASSYDERVMERRKIPSVPLLFHRMMTQNICMEISYVLRIEITTFRFSFQYRKLIDFRILKLACLKGVYVLFIIATITALQIAPNRTFDFRQFIKPMNLNRIITKIVKINLATQRSVASVEQFHFGAEVTIHAVNHRNFLNSERFIELTLRNARLFESSWKFRNENLASIMGPIQHCDELGSYDFGSGAWETSNTNGLLNRHISLSIAVTSEKFSWKENASNEAWIHMTGRVNNKKIRYWCSQNPHRVQESPFHNRKFRVWCTVSTRRIIGPIFYE
ncbi:hypothetical protein ANN_24468 [Periplaneta americana]|uniref:Uncharacterized protein n=1 Tax=Periplaneta americana TaxID=6978 RepID=A0ABQ8S3H4_PERAM|nr:hypothetical protein ANN_24468 [Periplaneta americana]